MRATPIVLALGIVMAAIGSGACGHMIRRQSSGEWLPGKQYAPNGCVLILKVADGVEHAEGAVGGSGEGFRAELREQLNHHGLLGLPSESTSVKEGSADATKYACGYVLKATITEWEENATEWSGKADTFAVSADLYMPDGTIVATARHRVEGSQSLMLARTPDRFYPEVADSILGKFFGWRPTTLTPR